MNIQTSIQNTVTNPKKAALSVNPIDLTVPETPRVGPLEPAEVPSLKGGEVGEGGNLGGSPLPPQTIGAEGAEEGGKQGEEGGDTPSTPSDVSNAEFLAAIFTDVPDGAQAVVTARSGDPEQGVWIAHPASKVESLCTADRNTYVNCASFTPDKEGKVAARKANAAAYHVLVLDDVGTKVEKDLLGSIKPTWKLETSTGNFQVGFKLSPPLHDAADVEKLQKQIAAAGLTDKGALGMARWVRLPKGINGKPKHSREGKPFLCRLAEWNPEVTFTADELTKLLVPNPVASEPEKTTREAPTRRKRVASTIDAKVFINKSDENPVVTAFKQRGLYKSELSPGKHDVTCPWVEEHTDALDTGAAYFEPDDEYPAGGFCCQHSHKDKYHISQVLDFFELSPSEGRNKPLIRSIAGEMNAIVSAAEEVLAQRGDLYQSGGLIVTAGRDPVSGDASLVPLSETSLTLALADGSDWEKYDKRSSAWERCDPPIRHVSMIYKAQTHDRLPTLKGLARQPYYREGDGQLVRAAGYDSGSKLLGVFDASKFPPVGSTRAAAEEALAQLDELLGEFHFATPSDKSAALCAIFTAVTRPTLGLAPAFHVSAPSSGSGKSYLCETISLFAGPGTPARMSYPKTSEEASKAILAVLLTGPAVIEFDDMDTDWIPHGVINRMLTSRSITDRILGVSKVATVRTDALVLGSGNNVSPMRDLARRVLTINLNARTEAPGTLVYKGNPVGTLQANRERYVSAVLTIIEAWKAAGCPKESVKSIASYGGKWSDFCRQPLLWLGQPDPAAALLEQMLTDPDADTLLRFLQAWHISYGGKAMQVRHLLSDPSEADFNDALMDLPVVERGAVNRSKLGHYLKRNKDRIVGGYMVQKVPNTERNAWRVVKTEQESPTLPPLPPSSEPVTEGGELEDEF